MRRPETIERLYLDFDGFFAAVHQQVDSRLQGRPVGVIPYDGGDRGIIIACSREAKEAGVKSIMSVPDARRTCPNIAFIVQRPDLYRRAHNALISEISSIIPVDAIKSIDELTCRLDLASIRQPHDLALRIKRNIRESIGPYITSTIGFAANRQIAKMACKAGKWTGDIYGDGFMVWHPDEAEAHLARVKLEDVPGVGGRMATRLGAAGVTSTAGLYALAPKQMRKLWRSVTGERLWYALHGYDIQAEPTERGMYGHARVLPPGGRSATQALNMARLLTIKAARRLRRAGYYAGGFWLYLGLRGRSVMRSLTLPSVKDDKAILDALGALWAGAVMEIKGSPVFRIGVTLVDLTPAHERQTDMFLDDDVERLKWESATAAVDQLNGRYARTLVSFGPWSPPEGGNVGGKISYTRIPSAEDFW